MRPSLNVISPELCARVIGEAKRILAESGMEIRGPGMKQRLLDHGMKTSPDGVRILFSRDVVDRAIETAPKSFTLYNRDGLPHAELGGNNVHYVPGSSGLKIRTTAPAKHASRIPPISSNTRGYATASTILRTLRPRSRRTRTSSRRSPTRGACTCCSRVPGNRWSRARSPNTGCRACAT